MPALGTDQGSIVTETLRDQAEHAAFVLAPETDLLADPDAAGLGRALAKVIRGDDHPDSADEWRAHAARHDSSWWQDWAKWSAENSGPLADPPPTGSNDYPVLDEGPGKYIYT